MKNPSGQNARSKTRLETSLKAWSVAAWLTCSLLLAPLLVMAPTAQAKPPAHAPAWGYRAKHEDYRKHKDDDYHHDYWQKKRHHRGKRRVLKRHVLKRRLKRRAHHRRRYVIRSRRVYRHGKWYRQYYRVYR
jgi:hypothetical protein